MVSAMKIPYSLLLILFVVPLSGQIRFEYDTYNWNDNTIEEEFASDPLKAGVEYTMQVEGTYSIWPPNNWSRPCGVIEDAAMFPSDKGYKTGNVGFDFEYIFSYPNSRLCAGVNFPFNPPKARIEISLDNGNTWFHPTTSDLFDSSHLYTYEVTGQGHPIGVRHRSNLNSDDYGVLKFTFYPQEPSDTIVNDTLVKDTLIIKPVDDIYTADTPVQHIVKDDTVVNDTEVVVNDTAVIVFEMPNVFSPNNDGKNDLFEPKELLGIRSGEILIYNRWGQLLYLGDINLGWDGTYQDKECAAGVYYWIAHYTDVYGVRRRDHGTLTLLR